MLNYIRETRRVREGLYDIILEIPQNIYSEFYEEVSDDLARDILDQYLKYRQDDARASDVRIHHDKQNHTINIYADLHYLGNKKTDQEYYTDNHMRT